MNQSSLFLENPSIDDVCRLYPKQISHTFNPAVITAYNNLLRYEFELTDNYLLVHGIRKDTLFLLNESFDYSQIKFRKEPVIYSELKTDTLKKKITEIEYNLDEMFTGQVDKQVRRGVNLRERPDIEVKNVDSVDICMSVFEKWKEYKLNDPSVFRISFTPDRYKRTYLLKELGFNILEKIIYVKGRPYAIINFSIGYKRAYELSFVSLFFEKDLKIINDLNDCIIISCMYELYTNHGVRHINLGTDAGIKGLKFFKRQFAYQPVYVYKN